ncbi:glycosyltransferase [Thermodesulfobacteriota bacterium]
MINSAHKHQKISIVIPIFNEQDTVVSLHEKILKVMIDNNITEYEVILIDDGSTDKSWSQIENLFKKYHKTIKAIKLRKNFGKSTALNSGFKEADGDIIFTMDADLQDDPEEIPRFIEKLDEGFDLVSGWKIDRKDPLSKTLPSKIFNKITAFIAGIKLNDFNCGFKAYRKEVVKNIKIYGELHRYIPVLANEYGFKVGEIPVKHHRRMHGHSKYGFERYTRGFLDLLTVLVITKYLHKPGHFFGGCGIISGIFGCAVLCYLVVLWFLGFRPIGNRPLLFFGIMAVILSVQLISFGLLAEISIRKQQTQQDEILIEKKLK